MHPIIWILIALAAAALGCFGGFTYRKNYVKNKIGRTEDMAKRLYDDAVKKAEDYKKEKVLEAKEEILKAKAENDREKAALYAKILYQQSLLIAGLPLNDPAGYTDMISSLMK